MDHSTTTPPAPPARPGLGAVTRLRVADQIVDLLTEAILDGRYQPGGTLPPERELADDLGVNRTSLRQALSRLEQLGLVEARQGRGTIVRDPTEVTDPRVLSRLIHHLGDGFLAELFEVREEVLGMVARLAAARAGTPDIERLRRAVGLVRGAGSNGERQAAELVWFSTLVEVTANRALILLLRWVWRAYTDTAVSFEPAFADGQAIAAQLESVVDAVARHRPAAAEKAMAAYSASSGAHMLECFRHVPEDHPRDPSEPGSDYEHGSFESRQRRPP